MGRGPSIEARKNATDAQRGKIYTKIIREISVAARAGGGDPAGNPRLRSAIDKALSANMSKDVIERAVRKATGELEGVEYEEIRYEGYAPGGVAVIVDCLTDNKAHGKKTVECNLNGATAEQRHCALPRQHRPLLRLLQRLHVEPRALILSHILNIYIYIYI